MNEFQSAEVQVTSQSPALHLAYPLTRALSTMAFPLIDPPVLAKRMMYPTRGWDEAVTRAHFRRIFGREIDLQNPVTFSEKISWLKLFNRRPAHRILADKVAVHDFVAGRGFADILIERYGIWDRPEDVPLETLPASFVLKAAHGWRMNWIRRPGDTLQADRIQREMRRWVRTDHSMKDGEWQYRGVPRRLLAEPYLNSPSGQLTDFRIYCFGGTPRFFRIRLGSYEKGDATAIHLDTNWEIMPFGRRDQPVAARPPRPAQLERMLEIAAGLSAGEPFLRVDLYGVGDRTYFSELTLHPDGGAFLIHPPEWDIRLGSWIKLPDPKTVAA